VDLTCFADHKLDSTKLKVWLTNTELRAYVLGTEDTVAEIGEQLAWMGAALRSSGADQDFAYCYPSVRFTFPSAQAHDVTFNIQYTFEGISRHAKLANGSCWFSLFRNPTIVKGYPIPSRSADKHDAQTGLEIPLNMMAGLVKASRVTKIDNQLLIKGFSTLFIPTKRIDDLIVWHMIFNEDDSHISYFDTRATHIIDKSAEEVDFICLRRARHILGWCSMVKHLAGTPTPILC
jgi:hypothetical protein